MKSASGAKPKFQNDFDHIVSRVEIFFRGPETEQNS